MILLVNYQASFTHPRPPHSALRAFGGAGETCFRGFLALNSAKKPQKRFLPSLREGPGVGMRGPPTIFIYIIHTYCVSDMAGMLLFGNVPQRQMVINIMANRQIATPIQRPGDIFSFNSRLARSTVKAGYNEDNTAAMSSRVNCRANM